MKVWTDKATFGAGELSPTMARRSDTQQHADGARKLRNVRLLNAGGFTRRPGSLDLAGLHAGSRLVEFTFDIDQQYALAFSPGRMDAFFVDGSPAGSLTDCPWSATDVPAMTWAQSGDTIFLCSRSWHPQVIRRTGASSWSLGPFVADIGPGDSLLQPYYKFADPDVTIQPSATSGPITLVASAPAFYAKHVGQRLRWGGSEFLVTSVTDSTHATADVLQVFPPSMRLTMESTVGFRAHEIVEGRNSAAKAEVIAVASDHIDVVITEGAIRFVLEEVDGPNASSKTTAVTDIDPLPYRDWDEPYWSPIYGFPAAVGIHRQRLWMGGHTRLPSSVLASRVGAHFNFDLGTAADSDAIFEDIGDGAIAWVRHFASAEHLLVMTDQGAYYVPESAANPIRPTSIQFNKIGAHGCGQTRPQSFDEGVLYCHMSGAAVMDVRPTGDNTRSWSATDVALLASHLVRNPIDVAATHGGDGAPERYAFFVNADGTLGVMHSIQSQQVLGWSLWETDGDYRSVAVLGGHVLAAVERPFAGGTAWRLERFDQALCTDGAVLLPTGVGVASLFASMAVRARSGTSEFGGIDIAAGGAVPDLDLGGAPLELGRFFRPLVETLSPEPKMQAGGAAARVKRISRIRVFVLDALRVRVGDRVMEAAKIGEDVTAAPTARTEWIEAGLLGRSKEPTVTMTQDECLPMTILGISLEVII